MRKLLLSVIFLLSGITSLQAQYWQQTGNLPAFRFGNGKSVEQILPFRNDTAFVFTTGVIGGYSISLSTDKGVSWSDTQDSTITYGKVFLTSKGTMLQSSGTRIVRSTNFGKNWSTVLESVNGIAITDGPQGEYFAIGYPEYDSLHIYHSTDDGQTWKSLSNSKLPNFTDIIYHTNSGILISSYYQSNTSSYVLHSGNFGVTWDTVFSDPQYIHFVATDHFVICLQNDFGYFFTSTSGLKNTWIKRPIPPFNQTFFYNITPGIKGGEILAPNYFSFDTGQTWKKAGFDSTLTSSQAVVSIDSLNNFFVGSGDNIFRSTDQGKSWYNTILPVEIPQGIEIPMIATSGSSLWIPQYRNLSRSTDDGKSWSNIVTDKFTVTSSVACGLDGSLLAGVRDTGFNFIVVRTSDNGSSWSSCSKRQTNFSINFLGEAALNKLIVVDELGYCHHSEDNGKTWKVVQMGEQPGNNYTAFCIADSLNVYAGLLGGISYSHTGGTSWKSHLTPSPANIVTSIGPGYNNSILAVFDTISLMRSTDDGYSWNSWSDGIPTGLRITGIVRDADSGVYVSTSDGVFYQPRGGTSWFEATVGLTDRNVQSITSRNGKTLFVSCAHTGIFRAENIAGSVRSASELKNIISVYPNPLSSSATISYSLSHYQFTKLELTNQLGRVVRVLQEGSEDSGLKNIPFSSADIPSGIYCLRLQTGDEISTTKLIITK